MLTRVQTNSSLQTKCTGFLHLAYSYISFSLDTKTNLFWLDSPSTDWVRFCFVWRNLKFVIQAPLLYFGISD